jgi:competence protein ComEC
MRKLKQYFGFFVVGALVVVVILVWTAVFAKADSSSLKVDFFDVGQGKAVFIEEPGGSQILIDGGPDGSVVEKLSSAMPYFDRKIDLLILTHPDSDHLTGLIEVLKRYSVESIIETGIADPTALYQEWHKIIEEKNIPLIFALAGQKIKIGDQFLLEILFPNRSLVGQSFSNTNSSSIVAKLSYGKNSFLFTGDAEEPTEFYLVGSGAEINADILDVGHHGSKNSTSQEFLKAVSPDVAIIQVGKNNRYGHPAQEILERLKDIKVFRTDLQGDIDFSCDFEKCASDFRAVDN